MTSKGTNQNLWDVPNAEFAPGLVTFPFESTPLDKAFSVKPVAAVDGTIQILEGQFPKDWAATISTETQLGRAQGGFTVSQIQAATQEYFRLTHPDLNQPDSIHLQINFLQMVLAGPFIFKFKDLKLGRTMSTVQVEQQAKDSEGKLVTRTLAIVSQGNLALQKGLTGTMPQKFDIPRREDCKRWNETWWMNVAPVTRKLRQYIPEGDPSLHMKNRFGPGIRQAWVKMDDGSGFDSRYLGQLCDPWLSVATSFGPEPQQALRDMAAFMYPTVAMSLEIKKDPAGAEWLFTRVEMRKVEKGRYGIDVYVLDETGDLVALSRLMSFLFPVKDGALGSFAVGKL